MKESLTEFDRIKMVAEFKEYCGRFPKLVLYGAGNNGKTVADYMEREGIHFSCFCVSDKPKRDVWAGHPVKSLDDVLASEEETGIIVAVSKDRGAQDIADSLKERGINCFYSEHLIRYMNMLECQESTNQVVIQDGYLTKVGDANLDRNIQYICCQDHIGDNAYIAGLIHEFKKQNPNLNKLCLIAPEFLKELVSAFPSVDMVLISDEIVKILNQYARRAFLPKTIVLKNLIFEVLPDVTSDESVARHSSPFRPLLMNPKFEKPVFDRSVLKSGKSLPDIMIMPYAKSAKNPPKRFWEDLVQQLRERNYSVGTNIGSSREVPIPGTEAVSLPLADMAVLCEGCKAVISLRSGICDLLAFTSTNLFIIYSSEELQEGWNVKKLFPREGIHEFSCFREEDLDSLANHLLAALESKDEKIKL